MFEYTPKIEVDNLSTKTKVPVPYMDREVFLFYKWFYCAEDSLGLRCV